MKDNKLKMVTLGAEIFVTWGINKLTMVQTSQANNFINVKSHARREIFACRVKNGLFFVVVVFRNLFLLLGVQRFKKGHQAQRN